MVLNVGSHWIVRRVRLIDRNSGSHAGVVTKMRRADRASIAAIARVTTPRKLCRID